MTPDNIQWFPGHMAKTRRMIAENLKNVDIVIEVLDARIPYSSRNAEIEKLTEGKPRLILLNKSSLADEQQTKNWNEFYSNSKNMCIATDFATGYGLKQISPAVKKILFDLLKKYEEKGMSGRHVRAMILGIPNVGKSSLINALCKNKKTKVENRPGVTLNKQWVTTDIGIDLLDMPGVLWPKFEEKRVGENLALTGAIKDDILDIEGLAVTLCKRLRLLYPTMFATRYKLDATDDFSHLSDVDLFYEIGRKRGFLVAGNEVDTLRTATMLLGEFRGAKIGAITLERRSKEELHA